MRKQKIKKRIGPKAFTLIELLVVVTIFVFICGSIVSILAVVLRGSLKSDSIVVVRQNGEYAVAQMVKMIRFAKSLDYPGVVGSSTSPTCSSTGQSVQYIAITSFDSKQTVFSCPGTAYNNDATDKFIASVSADIYHLTNPQTSSPSACSFVCYQYPGGPPKIEISFSLVKKSASGLTENNSMIPFQSSVTMRNVSSE